MTIWARQPGERSKPNHALQHFLALGPARSLDKAYTAHRLDCCGASSEDPQKIPTFRAPKFWKLWRREFHWDARAEAHDVEFVERQRLKRLDDIEEMNSRHAAIAVAAQSKIIGRLNTLQPDQLTPGQLIHWLSISCEIERRARGEATAIVRHDSVPATPDLSHLTDEELTLYERLLDRSHRRGVS